MESWDDLMKLMMNINKYITKGNLERYYGNAFQLYYLNVAPKLPRQLWIQVTCPLAQMECFASPWIPASHRNVFMLFALFAYTITLT